MTLAGLMCVMPVGAAHAAEPDNPAVVARPAANAELDAQPDAVTVAFLSNPKKPSRIVVEDADGRDVTAGEPRLVSTNLMIPMAAGLGPGTYTVKYRIEGPNGPEGGSYQFAIGEGDFDVVGFSTWVGPKAVPKDLAVPEDDATAGPSVGTSGESSSDDATVGTETTALGGSGGILAGDLTDDGTTADVSPWWPWVAAGIGAGLTVLLLWWLRRRGGPDGDAAV